MSRGHVVTSSNLVYRAINFYSSSRVEHGILHYSNYFLLLYCGRWAGVQLCLISIRVGMFDSCVARSDWIKMDLKDRFLKETDFCFRCGSQRCDKTSIWIEGCKEYQAWLDKEFNKVKNQEDNKVKFVQI